MSESKRQSRFLGQYVGLGLILLALAAFVLALTWQMRRGRATPARDHADAYLATGLEATGELFTLTGTGASGQFAVSGPLLPHDANGLEIKVIQADVLTQARVGSYMYDLLVRTGDDGSRLSWRLTGVMAKAGDEVGRAPAFHETGRLSYDPARRFGGKQKWPLWIDSLPARAIRLLPVADCGDPPAEACVEITGGKRRVTLERNPTSPTFRRLEPGEKLSLSADDRLWFGHVPLQVSLRDEGWLVAVDRSRIEPGKAVFLGSLVAEGEVAFPHGTHVSVHDVAEQLKGTELPQTWWSPETEDEYQLLIDEELLCVELRDAGGDPHPRVVWKTPLDRGCTDYLAETGTAQGPPPEPTTDEKVLAIYEQRRRHDSLVSKANEVMASSSRVSSADALPFVFEWWPVNVNGRLELLPVTLWGVRTQASRGPLWPQPSEALTDPALIARGYSGTARRMAVTDRRERIYVPGGGLAGLGPLLGHRGAVDGLDARRLSPSVPGASENELTIDLDLQQDLWALLKEALASFAAMPAGRSSTWGVTAVAMEPSTGDVLAVLNWPEALAFEDPVSLGQLRAGALGGQLRDSMNRAMLRDQDVGSTFKFMVMLAMANAGVLDDEPMARPSAVYQQVFTGPFAAAMTDSRGRVQPPGRAYFDGQEAPAPLGLSGMNYALDEATGASSNTFFAFAAMMLLSDDIPDVRYRSTCPIDATTLRRTDNARDGVWIICRSHTTLNAALNITQSVKGSDRSVLAPVATLMLLPEGTDLGSRARKPFVSPGRQGYFRTAFDGGYTFLSHVARPGRSPGRAVDVDGGMLKDYESNPRWRKWFPGLGMAEGRVFRYPALYSPGSFFSSVREQFGGRTLQSVEQGWRSFAQQAIGEGGHGSALSLAALYSAALREDGMFVAPRLLRVAGASPEVSPAYAAAAPEITRQRSSRLRQALAKPVWSGTARGLGQKARDLGLPLLGKTGTFSLTQGTWSNRLDRGEWQQHCGVLIWKGGLSPSPAPDWKSWLGTERCEAALQAVTLIHHYPATRPILVTPVAERQPSEEEEFTSFVALIDPSLGAPAPGRPGRALTFAVISDIEGARAASLVEKMLPALARWYQGRH